MYEQDTATVRHNMALSDRRAHAALFARRAVLSDAAALSAAAGLPLAPSLAAALPPDGEGGPLSGGDRIAFLSAYLAAREARGAAVSLSELLPMGPAPETSTRLPKWTPTVLQAFSAMDSGSVCEACSRETLSGIL